jgi:xylulokinase
LPVDAPKKSDFGVALGAARLAIVGHTGAQPNEVMLQPQLSTRITPRTELTVAYDKAYTRYAMLYPTLKALQ